MDAPELASTMTAAFPPKTADAEPTAAAIKQPQRQDSAATSSSGSGSGDGSQTVVTLFDLPNDLLDLLLCPPGTIDNAPPPFLQGHGYLPVSSLIAFACTCRAAAQLVLPRLYSNLHIASLVSFPVLFDTLARNHESPHPIVKFADQVRGITLLPNFIVARDQFDRVESALDNAKVSRGSSIQSVHQALARCGPDVLQSLPMIWLSRLASVCPNLISVDLSHLPIEQFRFPASIMFGFLNLARILRERRGRFIAPADDPFSCSAIIVKDDSSRCHPILRGHPTKSPYCVKSMDWGRQEMSIDNAPLTADFCWSLVPFSDLTSKDAKQQAKWRIRNLASRHLGPFEPPKPFYSSKDQVWKELGIRLDEDHIFDLKKHRPTGQVGVPAFSFADVDRRLATGFGLDARRDCSEATIIGMCTDKEAFADDEIYQFELRATRHDIDSQLVPTNPWVALTKLSIVNTLFFSDDNIGHYVNTFADCMPNLTALDLRNMPLTLDLVLFACDNLTRRQVNPLTDLHIECVYAPINPHPASSPRVTPTITEPNTCLTPLDMTRATRGHLHRLSLHYVGRGPHGLSRDKPSILIHPGLLHTIRDLSLMGVMMHVSPPQFAQPYHASFLPYCVLQKPTPAPVPGSALSAAFNYHPSLALRYTCLERLQRLEINEANVPFLLMPSSSVAGCLPRAPNLLELVFTDTPQFEALPWRYVCEVLERYPRLKRAAFWKTSFGFKDIGKMLAWIKGKAVEHGLVLENNQRMHEGTLLSAPHVAQVRVLKSSLRCKAAVVELVPTSVEKMAPTPVAKKSNGGGTKPAPVQVLMATGEAKYKDDDYEHLPDPDGLPLSAHLIRFGIRPAEGRAMIKDDKDKSVRERCVVCGMDEVKRYGGDEDEDGNVSNSKVWLRS
ncbi:hypothetical protein BCR44DRAFT_1449687 [Catenaria anguillulae PL171]|uniref:Uncharacterized protein n=1 Tax=Catenaria anguillulae PL171 TaxID=765915 RepID=A0A1Y2H669_9FUNG|nr:hypothetical protein BCR44DRAFT_1449687 [Catenaria anguillulae PL171]